MKKTYVQPESFVVNVLSEGMIAASVQISEEGVGGSNAWTNKKEDRSIWSSEQWLDEK